MSNKSVNAALKSFRIIALAVMAVGLSFGPAASQTTPIVLRAAHTAAIDEPYQIGLQKFADEIAKDTTGTVEVQIFPNGQLGDEGSVSKAIQSGSIAMAMIPSPVLADFVPELHLFDLPFLFRDRPHAYKALDGPVGQAMAKLLEAKGFVLLSYYEAGVRNILNNKRPINTLSDFKNMKMRVIPSNINLDTFRALGANPVPLPYSQIYTALQTHVIDAAEAANSNYSAKLFYEVAPYYAMVQWQILITPLVISKKIFDGMNPSQQAAIRKAGITSAQTERLAYQQADETALKNLLAHDVKVTRPDRQPWIDAVKPVWAKWAPAVGQSNLDVIAAIK